LDDSVPDAVGVGSGLFGEGALDQGVQAQGPASGLREFGGWNFPFHKGDGG